MSTKRGASGQRTFRNASSCAAPRLDTHVTPRATEGAPRTARRERNLLKVARPRGTARAHAPHRTQTRTFRNASSCAAPRLDTHVTPRATEVAPRTARRERNLLKVARPRGTARAHAPHRTQTRTFRNASSCAAPRLDTHVTPR